MIYTGQGIKNGPDIKDGVAFHLELTEDVLVGQT